MSKNKLITYFFMITLFAVVALFLLFYDNYQFKSSSLPKNVQSKIYKKSKEITERIFLNYGIHLKVPIIISNTLPNKNFGMASYNTRTEKIVIYLNKKRFQESEKYMINNVLPHEYAHALMFYFKNFSKRNSGHTKEWQKACLNLGGIKCDRFVTHQDIVIDKTNFFD